MIYQTEIAGVQLFTVTCDNNCNTRMTPRGSVDTALLDALAKGWKRVSGRTPFQAKLYCPSCKDNITT